MSETNGTKLFFFFSRDSEAAFGSESDEQSD